MTLDQALAIAFAAAPALPALTLKVCAMESWTVLQERTRQSVSNP